MGNGTKGQQQKTSPPQSLPQTTPQAFAPMQDHSFTLQAVMEMQKALGQATQAIATLTEEQKKSRDMLEGISKDIHAAKFSMRIILCILGFVASGVGIAFWKIWDVVLPLIQIKSQS